MEISAAVSQKLRIDVHQDPAIPFLGIYPKENGSSYHRMTCSTMLITDLITIARNYKQPSCPSMDGWIKKMW